MQRYSLDEIAYLNKTFLGKSVFEYADILNPTPQEMLLLMKAASLRRGHAAGMWFEVGAADVNVVHDIFEKCLAYSVLSVTSEKRFTLSELTWFELDAMQPGEVFSRVMGLGYSYELANAMGTNLAHTMGNVAIWWEQLQPAHREIAEQLLVASTMTCPDNWPYDAAGLDAMLGIK